MGVQVSVLGSDLPYVSNNQLQHVLTVSESVDLLQQLR